MRVNRSTGSQGATGGASRPLFRRALHGALWSLLSQAATALVTLIVFITLTRLVGQAEFGEYMLAVVGVGAVQWLALNAYREPVIQASELTAGARDTVFWFTAGVAALLTLIALGMAGYLRWHGQMSITASCLSLLAIKLLFDTLASVPMALCLRALQFRLLARINIAVSVLGLLAGLALLHAGWGAPAVAAMQALMSGLSFALVLAWCNWLPGLHFAWRDLGVLRSYSPHVVLWQGIEALNLYLDRLLVGTRLSPQALGLYGFGRRLNDVVVDVLVGAAGNVALPTYARLQDDHAELKRAFVRSLRLVTFAVFPAIGILYGVADVLVGAVFGEQWVAAVPIYRCFLLLGVLQTVGVFQAALMRGIGEARLWARYQILQAVANAAVLYFAVDHGIYVLAIAVLARTSLVWLYAVFTTCRLIGMTVPAYLRIFLKPAAGAVLACLAAQGALHFAHLAQGLPPMVMVAAAAVAAGLTYVAAALLLMKPEASDIRMLIASHG